MAAMFFQGTLGSFMAYSQIGGSPVAQAPGPSGQPPGSYKPAAPTNSEESVSSQSLTIPKSRRVLATRYIRRGRLVTPQFGELCHGSC